ncbi:ABC transporter ATP-binding protein [Celeribacter persicus]|uniref:NitT/TauT family transport system ATP-binding protein n=1 Tax=Celeribacter persicus TaxID=1651082 RepID=A0A2T5H4C8_9RHOB|nr:ABC transporter ATP-binding protein [Celeribacter persicus]PTQ66394.1 NitT/TauT family transport system ATP-binding protein [Celeribacter persicus]
MNTHNSTTPRPPTGPHPRPQPIFELAHAGVTFTSRKGKDVIAVEDMNLTVNSEEIVSLVGPSGCGKSTVLRVLAGLQPLTSGDVWIGGGTRKPGFAEVAIVFQKPTLLPWLTVRQNIFYPVRALRRRPDRTLNERCDELLDIVGLSEMADRMPHELSGGMQQRASIARSLILDPKILLMDEPFGALDALTREDLQLDLLDLHARTRKTILLVTHSINEAVLLSDRVAVMSARPGRLQNLIEIDIPRPRGPDCIADPDFQKYAAHIRTDIFGPRYRKEAHA